MHFIHIFVPHLQEAQSERQMRVMFNNNNRKKLAWAYLYISLSYRIHLSPQSVILSQLKGHCIFRSKYSTLLLFKDESCVNKEESKIQTINNGNLSLDCARGLTGQI